MLNINWHAVSVKVNLTLT